MSHSTSASKMASPAVGVGWRLPLSISFPRYCISTQGHCGLTPTQGGWQQSVCVHAYWCSPCTHCTLKTAWMLARLTTHAPSVFDLTASTQKHSVGTHTHTHTHVSTQKPDSDQSDMLPPCCTVYSTCLPLEQGDSGMGCSSNTSQQAKVHSYQTALNFSTLIIATDWMWTSEDEPLARIIQIVKVSCSERFRYLPLQLWDYVFN